MNADSLPSESGRDENSAREIPKKRNRWGSAQDCVEKLDQVDSQSVIPQSLTGSDDVVKGSSADTEKEGKISDVSLESKSKRKSRWSSEQVVIPPVKPTGPINPLMGAVAGIAPIPDTVITQETMQQIMILKIQLNQINESLLTVVQDAKAMEQNPNRSPSPPPKYDSSGKRTNLRESRMREALLEKRSKIIEEMMRLNPTMCGPIDFLKSKPVRRIFLPKQTNPLYNPIGLIIGPRGNTQKQLEQETGCKISVRGKGSAKEGSKGRASKVIDEDEELHVHIIGDTEDQVEKAAKLIEDILKPDDENLNVYKQKQLRELALINGTLREDEYCPICGEKGHKQFECPHRAKAFKAAAVKCAICGDLSHPTRDCPQKNDGPTNEVALDSEYDSFLAELGEGPGPSGGGRAAAAGGSSGGAGSTSSGAAGASSNGGAGSVTRNGQTFMQPIVDLFAPMPQQRLPGSEPPAVPVPVPVPMMMPVPGLPVIPPIAGGFGLPAVPMPVPVPVPAVPGFLPGPVGSPTAAAAAGSNATAMFGYGLGLYAPAVPAQPQLPTQPPPPSGGAFHYG